jgi:integrase/recombinase XerD
MARPARFDANTIELFLDMLAAERGASANTLDAYRRDLTDFADDLSGRGLSIAKASGDDIRDYLGRLGARGLATASLARKLSSVRQLYSFLYAEGHRGDDPAAAIDGPKRGRSLPKTLSIKDVEGLLAQARIGLAAKSAPERLRAARLTCLLEVLYATGLRVSELVALPESAARRDQRMLAIRGKGGRERLVPLNEAAKRAMADYLALRAEAKLDASKWLFPSFGESGHLTRQHFARELKALQPRGRRWRRPRG